MNLIKNIYQILLEKYGPQGWWPLLELGDVKYKNSGSSRGYHPGNYELPLTEEQQFEIIAGAILTQNTSWDNVVKALLNLKQKKLISVHHMNQVNEKELALLIRPSGYFNQKAKRLKNMASFLSSRQIKKLFAGKNLRAELLSLNGIGPETADSIMLYAAKKPIFVIDAYTKRIFARLGYRETGYDKIQSLFMSNLEHDAALFNEYHALIVELAKKHCRKKPVCSSCPLAELCSYNKSIS